ncbi:hypothetical protein AKJ16_DCAP06718 [Drosera capensis]
MQKSMLHLSRPITDLDHRLLLRIFCSLSLLIFLSISSPPLKSLLITPTNPPSNHTSSSSDDPNNRDRIAVC